MNLTTRRSGRPTSIRLLATIAALIAPWISASRAEAQYGYGFGWGGGFYNPGYATENYLNSRSLINASAAAANRPQALTAPRYESRDDSIYEKYDLSTREAKIGRAHV